MTSEACDFTLEVPEIDGAILMKLLEEYNGEHTKDDRLELVIQSLEAEIGGDESIDPHMEDYEDCRLDDILSDLNSHDCSTYMAVEDPFEFDWVEMEVGSNSHGEDLGGWYMDEGGMVAYGDGRDYGGFYYGESSTEQVYIPLWQ